MLGWCGQGKGGLHAAAWRGRGLKRRFQELPTAPFDPEASQCLETQFSGVKTDAGSPRYEGARFPMRWPTMTARPVYTHNESCTDPFAPLVAALESAMPDLHAYQNTAGLVTMREQLFRGGPMP